MLANFPTSSLPGPFPSAAGRSYSASQGLARQHSLQQYSAQQQQCATQQTWQRADLDAIGVPAACNLPASQVENMKQQWEGKPIQLHTGLQNCIQSEPFSRELAQWKKYLLQVSQRLLSARNLLVKSEVIPCAFAECNALSAYDRLSVELGYQVFSRDEDDDVENDDSDVES